MALSPADPNGSISFQCWSCPSLPSQAHLDCTTPGKKHSKAKQPLNRSQARILRCWSFQKITTNSGNFNTCRKRGSTGTQNLSVVSMTTQKIIIIKSAGSTQSSHHPVSRWQQVTQPGWSDSAQLFFYSPWGFLAAVQQFKREGTHNFQNTTLWICPGMNNCIEV